MITVSDQLLTTLKQSFEAERQRLCRDAAKILRIPESELKQRVLQAMPPYKLTVYEEDEKRQTCAILVQRATVLERCRGSCLMGTGRCLHHQTASNPPELPTSVQHLTRLERLDTNDPPMWCNEETGDVLNAEGVIVGKNNSGVLELYTFEEDDDE